MSEQSVQTEAFTIDRSEFISGGNGARVGFSDDFPDRQFLFIPKRQRSRAAPRYRNGNPDSVGIDPT